MVRGPIARGGALDRGEWRVAEHPASSGTILQTTSGGLEISDERSSSNLQVGDRTLLSHEVDLDVTSLADFFTNSISPRSSNTLFNILHKAGIMLFYTVSAISMTLLNKSVLNHTPVPVTLMVCQSFVGWGLMRIVRAIGGRWGNAIPKWDWNVAKQLGPLVIVNVLGLT